MAYQLMKDGDATRRLLEYVGDTQGGKRTLSRLSRTCRGFCEPGLGLLWKELDSLMPLVTLFPSTLYKRARRPGLGLAIMPIEEDWKQILHYGEFVRRLTYDESQKAVSPSFFPVIEEYRPRTYILPNLTTLVWRATTPAGLERIQLFLNPDLQNLVLEIGARLPELSTFLVDLSLRTRLASLSLSCPHTLPENFPHLLEPQDELEKLALMAPGALSAGVGKWAASLPMLRSLELDLTGRSGIAVEGFFDDILSMDGYHTPSSVSDSSGVSRDSGVFSAGEDIDFTSIKKSTLQLVEDRVPRIGAFARLQSLHLTGEVGNVVTFLKHIASPLVNLELVVEDPFDKADWQDLCYLICQYFGDTLQSLKVTASSASRFADLVRSTPRGDTFVARRLPLDGLSYLPCLTRLEIDLPESIILRDSDIASVARACPNIEVLRLCPAARFSIPSGGPTLSLEGLAALTMGCRNLHTLAVVVNGSAPRTDDVYFDLCVSSRSLMRLQLGHSWVRDPLQIAILLSHLAPRLDMLKWFHDKNRPGYIETHAQGWQRVFEFLPYLQEVRLTERWVAQSYIPEARNAIMVDRGVDATVSTCDRSVGASVSTTSAGVQCMPQTVNRSVEARVMTVSVEVDATPTMADAKVEASPSTSNASVEARPDMVSEGVDARPTMISESVDARPVMVSEGIGASPTMISEGVDARPIMVSEGVDATHSLTVTKHVHFATPESTSESDTGRHYIPQLYIPQAVSGAVSLAWRAMVFGPNFVTARIYDIWTLVPFTGSARRQELRKDRYPEKPAATADEDGMELWISTHPQRRRLLHLWKTGMGILLFMYEPFFTYICVHLYL
ncbi:hypothetical protein OF83DRAFT_413019 [Amylostereum chailletii]|nr:hypothetical protein OF83DRAFT_413019 [Amylostereum chailletii]